MNKILIATWCICLPLGNLWSQFSGRVVDVRNKPIQDVLILNLRTLNHTHTDALGNFIDKNSFEGDSIQFSTLGYSSLIYKISSLYSTSVEIILKESSVLLEQVDISVPLNQNLQRIDILTNPVQNSQELLRKVPGLFIAQHAGGGKAEQMFLRGFDMDHGTDINVSVDHLLPVNMPSHAHGQGYSDLHFVIPETVSNIEYDKGSYNASKGNFATAGYVDFVLKDHLSENSIVVEAGKFRWNRLAALIKLMDKPKNNSFIAAEYTNADGYFENPQGFEKINILVKDNFTLNHKSGIKWSGSFFNSHWNASGQVPQRAINSGQISRFGSIDPTEGGSTDRSNFLVQYYLSNKVFQNVKISAYYSAYNFELFSNFTFFLSDSVNGDQIKQKEKRNIYGFESSFDNQYKNFHYSMAIGFRIDDVKNSELSHTKDRVEILERKSFGNIFLQNYYTFAKINWEKSNWSFGIQCRGDYFDTYYENHLQPGQSSSPHLEVFYSPKFVARYTIRKTIQLYSKSGIGFHSNDTRILNSVDDNNLLTRSINSDVGIQLKLFQNLLFHSGLWYIDLEDELVYVGDEGIVESSGHTRRKGIEIGARMQPNNWLFLEAEGSYTIAKIADANEGNIHIPLASKWCSSGGIYFENIGNFSLGIRYRLLGDRPANEDNSIVAKGYTLLDANLNYSLKNLKFSLITENILNRQWNEAQFATLSRLKNELNPVEEIHFTPGTPFNIKFRMMVSF